MCGCTAPGTDTNAALVCVCVCVWFALHQAHNGQWRAIDDGKRSGHNLRTFPWAKVHTCELAYVAAVGRLFIQHLPKLKQWAERQRKRLLMEGGTDDESSAYRWKVVQKPHRRYNLCA